MHHCRRMCHVLHAVPGTGPQASHVRQMLQGRPCSSHPSACGLRIRTHEPMGDLSAPVAATISFFKGLENALCCKGIKTSKFVNMQSGLLTEGFKRFCDRSLYLLQCAAGLAPLSAAMCPKMTPQSLAQNLGSDAALDCPLKLKVAVAV